MYNTLDMSTVGSCSAARTTVLLFLLFQALYGLTLSGNLFRVPDEFEVYFQTEHLVDAGNLSVPQSPVFFGTIGRDGRRYAPYGPLTAFLSVPHHLLGRLVARIAGIPRTPLPGGLAWLFVVAGITMLATATAAALAVAGFHRAARALGTPPRAAVALSLMLGGATMLWTYGVSFYSEAWQAAAFAWAAALLLEARGDRSLNQSSSRLARIVAAAALVAVAGLTKVTSLVFAPAFVAAALIEPSVSRRARVTVALVLAAAIGFAAAVHIAWNVSRFGQPFNFGYDWSQTIPQLPARPFLLSDLPRGLVVLLISPGKSIVVWAPPVLLAVAGARRFARTEPAVAAGVAIAAIAGLLVFGAYLFPEGGYAHGPRHLVPILPLILLLAGGPAGRWRRTAVVACVTTGVAIAFASTAVSFLEDQTLGPDLTRTGYYQRVTPPPGRPWNRYALGYVPFARTLGSPGWLNATTVGVGPDYWPLHLLQVRRRAPDGARIPLWLIWGWPCFWVTLCAIATAQLQRTLHG